MTAGGATSWVTATVAIGADPNQQGGGDFTWISNQGHTVIVRLNYGYCPQGTIPIPDRYDDFAQRAAVGGQTTGTRFDDILLTRTDAQP